MQAAQARLIGKGSPFELSEAVLNGIPCRLFRHGPHTLNDIYAKAEAAAQRPLVVCESSRQTYEDILQRANALARILEEKLGITRGMRVALILGNGSHWITAFIAITSIGATAVIIHSNATSQEIRHALECTETTSAIVDTSSAQCLPRGADPKQFLMLEGSGRAWSKTGSDRCWIPLELTSEPLRYRTTRLDPESCALIAFTSGSTGRAKAVTLNHRSIVSGMMSMLLGSALYSLRTSALARKRRPTASAPVSLLLAPLSHVSGYSHLVLTLYLAGTIVMVREWSTPSVLKLISQERVTSLVGSHIAMIKELLQASRAGNDLSSLQSIGSHGGALPRSLLEHLHAELPNVEIGTGYGLTETNGSICMTGSVELLARPGSSGPPIPSVDLRILHGDEEAPAGAIGEIVVRGSMLMQGYCNPAASSDALENGWFRTGDLGKLDGDGCLHVIDRMRHVVQAGHVSVSPAAIEQAVSECATVDEVAAFGIADPHGLERLVIVVAMKSESPCNEPTIVEHLRRSGIVDGVAPQIVKITQMPRTPAGKIDRIELRRRALQGAEEGACPC